MKPNANEQSKDDNKERLFMRQIFRSTRIIEIMQSVSNSTILLTLSWFDSIKCWKIYFRRNNLPNDELIWIHIEYFTWTITAIRSEPCGMFCLHPLQPARPLFAYSVLYGSSSDIFSRFFAGRIQNLSDFEFQNNHTDTKHDFLSMTK